MFVYHLRFALIWAALILLICSLQGSSIPEHGFFARFHIDKIIHAVIFAVLCVLLAKGFVRQENSMLLSRHALVISFVTASLYGCSMELLQELSGLGRTGEWADVAANTAGAILGAVYFRREEVRKRHFGERSGRYF